MKSLRLLSALFLSGTIAPLLTHAYDNWTERTGLLSGTSSPSAGAYSNGRFFLFSGASTYWHSVAGTSDWSSGFFPSPPSFFSVKGAAAGGDTLVVTGTNNTLYTANAAQLATLPYGASTWTKLNPLSRNVDLGRVRHLNGRFIVGTRPYNDNADYNNNSYTELLVSTDGVTWESKQYIANTLGNYAGHISDAAFKPGATAGTGTWVFGLADANGILFTAPENLSALTRRNVSNLGANHTLAYGAGLFVLGTGNGQLWTSADGSAWTQRTASLPVATSAFRDIYFDGARFVAVGATVTGSNPARPLSLHSTDGLSWTEAATVPATNQALVATYSADGFWLAVAANRTLFTRGQSSVSAPEFTQEPSAFTGSIGGTITLTGAATGGPAPTFQWFKGGAALSDDTRISGVTTATLVITGATFADAGNYYLRASNIVGSKNSPTIAVSLNAAAGGAVFTPYGEANQTGGTVLPGAAPARSVPSGSPAIFTVGSGFEYMSGTSLNSISYNQTAGVNPSGTKLLLNSSSRNDDPPAIYDLATRTLTVLPAPTLPLGPIATINYFEGVSLADNGDVAGFIQTPLPAAPWSQNHAFHYSAATQTYTLLGNVPNSSNDIASNVGGISADGSTVSGYERTSFFDGPFIWNTTGGFTLLPAPANGGAANGDIRAISPNARYIVGFGNAPAALGSGQTAQRWDRGSPLGAPVGLALTKRVGDTYADARTVNDDGTVGGVVRAGFGYTNEHAALWLPDGALVVLADYLSATYGLATPGFQLSQITSISADRRTLAGTLLNVAQFHRTEGWIITLPQPITLPGAPRFAPSLFNTASPLADGASFALPNREVGASGTDSISIQNLGTQPLEVASATISGAHASDFSVTTTLPLSLAPGLTDRIAFRFAPTAAGARSATVTITTNDPARPTFTLTLTGTATGGVTKTDQTIDFPKPADITTATASVTLTATASSGLPVGFELVEGPATLSGATLSITGAGTVKVKATQAGNASFNAAPAVERSFTVTTATTPPVDLKSQKITFRQPTAPAFKNSPLTVALSASSNSGLTVAFTVVSGPATVSGSSLTVTDAGTIVIRASQAGDSAFEAAEDQLRTLVVKGATQKITFAQPPALVYRAEPYTLAATASSALPVTFELVSGPATLDGSVLSLTGAGKVVVRAVQPGGAGFSPATAVTRTITVAKAVLTVNFTDVTRLVRQPNPPLQVASYEGFISGDDASAVTSAPVASTKAAAASPAGVYPITIKGGVSADYTFVVGEGSVTVQGFGGGYEALLVNDDGLPLGKLELTVSANSLNYTGVLNLASEPAALSIRGELTATDGASAQASWSRAANSAKGHAALSLGFELAGDTLDGALSRDGAPALSIGSGTRLFVQALDAKKKKLPADWTGAHTLVLRDPRPVSETDARALPQGAGSGSAAIASTGVMTIKGTLADGAKLAATAKPDQHGLYRVFTRPYAKRLDSVLAGPLALEAHPDQTRFAGRFQVAEDDGLLFWSKAASPAKPLDKAYRDGFVADLVAILDPWIAPAAKAATVNGVAIPAGNLAQRLGLATSATENVVLSVGYGSEDLDLGERAELVPTLLGLNAKGAFSVSEPVTTPVNATKFSLKVTPATGAFTGSFTLGDTPEGATKPVTRKVPFVGTLRQGTDGSLIGAGHLRLPDLVKNAPEQSFEIRLAAPVSAP